MKKKNNLKKRIFTSLFLLFGAFLIFKYYFFLIFSLLVIFAISIIEFLNLTNRVNLKKFYFALSNFLFVIYLSLFCLIFVYFYSIIQLKIIIFSLLFCCVASDIGGFIFGKLFKGPKLTKISPNKTLSGSIGSLFFSIIIFSGIIFYFTNNFNLNILIIGLFTSIASQLGDLFFSFLKRKAKIKDTGSLLPGHGGFLDRLDGILIGLPLGLLFIIILY
tara:strand:+ start:385 stop:1038 length:654 start_codon:yes stop_codon:yes gene_type:complete